MNLIDMVKGQITNEVVNKLASLVGGGHAETQKAVNAGLPSILSGLLGLASTNDGATKLSNTLGALDTGLLGNLLGTLSGGQANQLGSLGGGLMGQLFSGAVSSALTNAIAKYSGLGSGAVTKLLGFLLPSILGVLAGQWKSRGATPSALQGLLSEQKTAIDQAMPSGFSLKDIPGLGGLAAGAAGAAGAATAARDTARDVHRAATAPTPPREEGGLPWWLLPLLGLLLLGLLGWWLLGRNTGTATGGTTAATTKATGTGKATGGTTTKATEPAKTTEPAKATTKEGAGLPPIAPAVGGAADLLKKLSGDTGVFGSLGGLLGGIKTKADAENAIPKLTKESASLDDLIKGYVGLPGPARAEVNTMATDKLAGLWDLWGKLTKIEGVGPVLTGPVTDIMRKLTVLTGNNKELAGKFFAPIFTELTKTLEGVKDEATAKAAEGTLKELSVRIDDLGKFAGTLPPEAQKTVKETAGAALPSLKDIITKVMGIAGVAAVLKPLLEQILGKLGGWA